MKDRRVAFVRGVLGELVDSLEATVRIARWQGEDAIPAPLRASAELLVGRLSRANRIAIDKFVGSPITLQAISELRDAILRLDVAFVAFHNASGRAGTIDALDAELGRVRAAVDLESTA
jgi:hypothetical protein